jgi:hypothetical protein
VSKGKRRGIWSLQQIAPLRVASLRPTLTAMNSRNGDTRQRDGSRSNPQILLLAGVTILVGAAPLLSGHGLVLATMLLPALSAVFVVAAGLLTAVAFMCKAAPDTRITWWDVSGALYFLGCAAAVLGEPDLIIPITEEARTSSK